MLGPTEVPKVESTGCATEIQLSECSLVCGVMERAFLLKCITTGIQEGHDAELKQRAASGTSVPEFIAFANINPGKACDPLCVVCYDICVLKTLK